MLDGANVAADVVSGQVTQYVRGLGLTALVQADGTRLQYVTDGHGDVKKLVNSSGTVVVDYTYDAFGNQTEEAEDSNPFRYAGEYWDSESGLIYLRARYYDSGVGAFVSEDPAKDGLNWYSYCAGNPVNFVDPTGNVITTWDEQNMSSSDLRRLEQYTSDWKVAAAKGDQAGMNIAANQSKQLRSKYLTNNQEVLDNGYIRERFSQTIRASGNGGAYTVSSTIVYSRVYKERNSRDTGVEITLESAMAQVESKKSGFRLVNMSGMYGQFSRGSSNRNSINTTESYYYVIINYPLVEDVGSSATPIGMNVTFSFQRGNGKIYTLEILNNVYETQVIDSSLNNTDVDPNLYDVLIEALQRGEREGKGGR